MSVNSLFHTECDAFSALCWSIGTPVAFRALKMLERCDWLGLVSIKVRSADYVCVKTFYEDSQVAAFFKKFPGFDLGIDLEAKAVRGFYESETQCYHSNERLNPLLSDTKHYGEGLHRLIVCARRKIKDVLRKAPTPAVLIGKFGPGSTFLNVGDEITIAHKLSDGYSRTKSTEPFLHSWDESAWSRYAACGLDTVGDDYVAECHGLPFFQGEACFAPRDLEVVRGNRFTTVPKDATKVRGICIEPSLNVFFQLAIGSEMSHRMRKTLGWQKDSAQEFHKNLARVGSLTGAVATIDLSNASDTMCRALIKLLLPRDWYCLVDSLRSSFTLIEGKWIKLEKFSSMGNGYTFELETLVFWALALSVQELQGATEDRFTPGLTISVFGDDIIVPTSLSKTLLSALKVMGFTPNNAKTFLSGNFRESCGGDYMAGHDVRPHFHKEICDAPHRSITLANGLRRFGRRHSDLGGGSTYRSAWFKCLDSIPRDIRKCRGPESFGDLVIIDDERFCEQENPRRFRSSIGYIRVWRPVPNRVIGWEHFRPGVVLAAALYGARSGAPSNYIRDVDPLESIRRSGIVPRVNGSYVSGYKFGRVAYS